MSLSNDEKSLVADHVADFAMKMLLSVGSSEQELHADLDDFHSFICSALEAAKRDGRREAMTTTAN